MYFNVALLIAAAVTTVTAFVSREAITTLHQQCKTPCEPWIDAVGGCVKDANATFIVSINTSDFSSTTIDGNVSIITGCVCSEKALQNADVCLSCATEILCVTPELTVDNYTAICAESNPQNLLAILQQYDLSTHPNCSNPNSTETIGTTGEVTETTSVTDTDATTTTDVTPTPVLVRVRRSIRNLWSPKKY